MLSAREQRVWDDVQRCWAEEVEEPPRAAPSIGTPRAPSYRRRTARDPADLPAAVVAGAWITIVLILLGAPAAGLTVGVATALGWALRHSWPRLAGQGAPDTAPDGGGDRAARRPADEPGDRRSRGTWNTD